MNFSQKGTPMYFTESPHLQSIEAAMKMIPRHPLTQGAEQKGSSVKLKFLSEDHRDRFLSLFKRLRTNPLRSEPEYCAAIYLLTADPGLWETVADKVKDESIEFKSIKLGTVDCDRYALYKSAKDILCHKFKLSLAELREMELLDITIKLIRTAVLVSKNGYGYIEVDKFGLDDIKV